MKNDEQCWCGSGKTYGSCHAAFDARLKEYRKKGYPVPGHALIKNEVQIAGIRRAGAANTAVLDRVSAMIRPGISTQDIDDVVREESIAQGGKSAEFGYEGFPKSVCVSVNDVVCHGIPSKDEILKEGDIVNVDATTEVNGYYGDSSRMFLIGSVSERAERLVRTTKEALDLATTTIKAWDHLGDIGAIINSYAKRHGYAVVREVGGHGVGLALHEEPYVSHVGKRGVGMILAPGMVFTIEPMINEGKAGIWVDEENGWTIRTDDGSLSAQWEYTLLMTENGLEILAH